MRGRYLKESIFETAREVFFLYNTKFMDERATIFMRNSCSFINTQITNAQECMFGQPLFERLAKSFSVSEFYEPTF